MIDMKSWIRNGTLLAAGVAVVAGAAAAIGIARWNRDTAKLRGRLGAASRRDLDAAEGEPGTFARDSVPPPVARYFAFALSPKQPAIRHAHLEFTGQFAAEPNEWAAFTAEQEISIDPPAFVWDARIHMLPLATVRVRDSYVGREGAMRASVAGVVPIVNQHGTPEIAAASLLRFLAEAVWVPTALLPRDGLSWSAIDDSTARVTLTDGPTTVSMDVHFGSRGEITSVEARRHREVNGVPVLTPWVGTHTDYRRVNGMMIPTAGEVSWLLPTGWTPYWRGRIVEATYEF